MSQFLGVSNRGGFQSESLPDGTLSISGGKIENATSITGIPVRKIIETSARLSTLENEPSMASVLENATSIGGIPVNKLDENTDRISTLENNPSIVTATLEGDPIEVDEDGEPSFNIETLDAISGDGGLAMGDHLYVQSHILTH